MTCYEAAQGYIKRGWSVIPIRPRDKRPLWPWKEFQTRLATPEELTEWFDGTENNLGIVAGKLSNLTIVDCDSQEAIEFFEKECAKEGVDPRTYMVQTPKGRHYYYRFVPGSNNFQAKKEWPGIDLRSEGGYVVGPPSIHPSGKSYVVHSAEALGVAPKWLFQDPPKPAQADLPNQEEDLFAPAPEGGRNMALTRLAGSLLQDVSLTKALKICRLWNRTNSSPLPDDELVRTVQSVANKEAKKHDIPKNLILEPESFRDSLQALRETGLPSGCSTGLTNLDDFYRVPLGLWTLITGIPGHGKSSFLSHLMVNLMENEGWKFVVFSAENLPLELFLARLLAVYLKKPFHSGPTLRLSNEEVAHGVQFFQAHLRFIDVAEGCTIHDILETGKQLKTSWDFQGLTIDPWNELPHPGDGRQKETDVIGEELTQIRRFSRLHVVHTWVVAHPSKMQKNQDGKYGIPTPYDVSGSAHFRNKADFCLTVWRDLTAHEPTKIYVQKVRFREHGLVGSVELAFDPIIGRYQDC